MFAIYIKPNKTIILIMTREEINKFLTNTKVYVNGKSREIQKKLFSFGYKWHTGDIEVDHIDYPFLFIHSNMLFSVSRSMILFSDHINREITAEEILSLEFTETREAAEILLAYASEEKFNPKTLQPFDKVLVRDYSSCYWNCDFFSRIDDSTSNHKYITVSSAYIFCIPYNDETKHLVGTSEEAPEYYRYWED